MNRKAYPTDGSDDEWALVAPDWTLMTETGPPRDYRLRESFNGLREGVRGGISGRLIPNAWPPGYPVYQQTQRWLKAGVLEALVHHLRVRLRWAAGRDQPPTGTIFDRRTWPSSPERGERAGDEGAKRRNGSKPHRAVDRLGRWLTRWVTPADEPDRAQLGQLAQAVQAVTGATLAGALVDPADTGDRAEPAAAEHRIRLEGVKLPDAKPGFVWLPRRWVVERSFGWLARFRRLARDYQRLPETLKGLHFLAFALRMAHRFVQSLAYCL
jgi:transposase